MRVERGVCVGMWWCVMAGVGVGGKVGQGRRDGVT